MHPSWGLVSTAVKRCLAVVSTADDAAALASMTLVVKYNPN